MPAMCRGEPAPIQTSSCWRKLRSIRTRDTFGTGNGATAPGSKPVAATTSSGFATRAYARPGGGGDLLRVRAPVARDEREHRQLVADEHERLHDLRALAADRLGRRGRGRRALRELLHAGVDGVRAQHGRDPLDRLRPRIHAVERTGRNRTG